MAHSRESAAFFLPYLTKEFWISFYGGEPLLNFTLIRQVVSFLKSNNHNRVIRFSVTTNGSLINADILDYFEKNRFTITFSFDGFAQNAQRKQGSFIPTLNLIKRIKNIPSIKFNVNSVFSWKNVHLLSHSLKLIMTDLRVKNINYSLAVNQIWSDTAILTLEKELKKLNSILLTRYKNKQWIPLSDYREFVNQPENRGLFYCAAGKDRLSITPDGKIWGCYLFPEYYKQKGKKSEAKKYLFGDFKKFSQNPDEIYKRTMVHYQQLTMENYSTPSRHCFLCPEIENCDICPVITAYSSSKIGHIPEFVCQLKKAVIHAKKNLLSYLR